FYKYVRKWIDTVASKYIKLDRGGRAESKQTRTERVKAEKAEKIKEQNPDLEGDELRKVLIAEKAYSYKEDMKFRIHEAALKSRDEKEFLELLKASGVEIKKKTSTKYGEHYVYDFFGCPVGAKNTKARSYKLGYSYGPEALRLMWGGREKQRQQEIQQEAEAFTDWLEKQGKSCFEFDDKGQLINTDFELLDKLHEEYEKERSNAKDTGITPDKPVIEPERPQKKPVAKPENLPGKIKTTSGTTSNRAVRQARPSSEAFRKDMEAVGKLINNIDDIIKRLSTAQEKPKVDSKRIDQAIAEFELNKKKDFEKSI
ncbi:MAG: relaxase/mobilization nuclease domain-containing protein, partial [Lachnospiraceae bacterium]|nr:relaxase/mobilization nuclease domain-containing protein [Lachnospiraceae bacterium]